MDKLILALDGIDKQFALHLAVLIGPEAYCVKVHDLLDGNDQLEVISRLKHNGAARVWVDYKLHDIPKTVGRRAKKLKDAGADIITVHASGGEDMVAAAVDSGAEIWAVTALTSLLPEQIKGTYGLSPAALAQYLTGIAVDGGAAGIVCSALEVGSLRDFDQRIKRIVPGTRTLGTAAGDQKRVATAVEALKSGANHLVIASEVTEAVNPMAAWAKLVDQIVAAQA